MLLIILVTWCCVRNKQAPEPTSNEHSLPNYKESTYGHDNDTVATSLPVRNSPPCVIINRNHRHHKKATDSTKIELNTGDSGKREFKPKKEEERGDVSQVSIEKQDHDNNNSTFKIEKSTSRSKTNTTKTSHSNVKPKTKSTLKSFSESNVSKMKRSKIGSKTKSETKSETKPSHRNPYSFANSAFVVEGNSSLTTISEEHIVSRVSPDVSRISIPSSFQDSHVNATSDVGETSFVNNAALHNSSSSFKSNSDTEQSELSRVSQDSNSDNHNQSAYIPPTPAPQANTRK